MHGGIIQYKTKKEGRPLREHLRGAAARQCLPRGSVQAHRNIHIAPGVQRGVLLALVILQRAAIEREKAGLPRVGEEAAGERAVLEQVAAFGWLLVLLCQHLVRAAL